MRTKRRSNTAIRSLTLLVNKRLTIDVSCYLSWSKKSKTTLIEKTKSFRRGLVRYNDLMTVFRSPWLIRLAWMKHSRNARSNYSRHCSSFRLTETITNRLTNKLCFWSSKTKGCSMT
jgi:hypothetical protein